MKKIGFYTAFILPAVTILGFYLGGWFNYTSLVFVFIVLPVIDQWIGLDVENVPKEAVKETEEDFYYRFVTYVWTFVQLAFLFWCAYVISTRPFTSISEWIGFTISVGLVTGGIGITVAHELGHKKSTLERIYSQLLLMTVCYMHFYIEHNRGHHVTVATPEDPATARKNQNFYAFWVRSVFVGYAHAWKLEAESLKRKNLPSFSIQNHLLWYSLLPIVFASILMLVGYLLSRQLHWEIAVFFFAQSVVAFTLLELVNYIEHYGIVRRRCANGHYERVNPLHSWNASHLLSNFFLFQLQRHSDHHAFAHKRYQILNHYNESPQLPYGYPTMILIALVPPLWFYCMNTRLQDWEKSISSMMDTQAPGVFY